jgi:hypothetical protein
MSMPVLSSNSMSASTVLENLVTTSLQDYNSESFDSEASLIAVPSPKAPSPAPFCDKRRSWPCFMTWCLAPFTQCEIPSTVSTKQTRSRSSLSIAYEHHPNPTLILALTNYAHRFSCSVRNISRFSLNRLLLATRVMCDRSPLTLLRSHAFVIALPLPCY